MKKIDKANTLTLRLSGELLRKIRKRAESQGFALTYYIRLSLARHFHVNPNSKSVMRGEDWK